MEVMAISSLLDSEQMLLSDIVRANSASVVVGATGEMVIADSGQQSRRLLP